MLVLDKVAEEEEDLSLALIVKPSSLTPSATSEVILGLEKFADAIQHGYILDEKRILDIKEVKQIVYDLEAERKRLHERLELESIKTSQLRSNFNQLKSQGEQEIVDAVLAARQLNLERIKALEREVKALDERAEFLRTDMVRLEDENHELDNQRIESQVEYDKIVEILNKQLSAKADKQIFLNEVRDQIKDTGEKIVEMEEDIIIQKEDLIHEREDAKIQKQQLVVAIEDEGDILSDQQKVNSAKLEELNVVLDELKKTKSELKSAKKTFDNLSHQLSMLNHQEAEYNGKVSRENEAISKLKKQLDDLVQEKNTAQTIFDEKEAELTKKLKLTEQRCEFEDERATEYQIKKKSIEDTEKQLKPKVKDLIEREQAITAALKQKKDELREIAERRADFDRRLQLANDQIISNTQLHKATMDQMAREFEQIKRMLMETREERDVTREKCDELVAEILMARDEQAAYLEKADRITRRQEQTLEDLTSQRDHYYSSIKNLDKKIAVLRETIENETQEFETMKQGKQEILDELMKKVTELEEAVNKNNEILSVERPIYEALKKEHADKTIACDKLKREVIGVVKVKLPLNEAIETGAKKAQVSDLEDKLKNANNYVRRFPQLLTSLEGELSRSDAMFKSNKTLWHNERMGVERDIVATWQKLKQTILENDHLNKIVNEVEAKIKFTEGLLSDGEKRQQETEQRWLNEQRTMEQQFMKFLHSQQAIRDKDQKDLDRYMVISEITDDRLGCVSDVLNNLNQSLDGMHDFLEILSGLKSEEPEKEPEIFDEEPLLQINA